jgi:hypothetical protein
MPDTILATLNLFYVKELTSLTAEENTPLIVEYFASFSPSQILPIESNTHFTLSLTYVQTVSLVSTSVATKEVAKVVTPNSFLSSIHNPQKWTKRLNFNLTFRNILNTPIRTTESMFPYETFSLDFELFANNSSHGARLKNKSSYHAAITSK